MRRTRSTAYCSLLIVYFLLSSCIPPSPPPVRTSLLLYRFNPPAFLEYSADFQLTREIPFSIPPNCGLFDAFPAPIGPILLIELSCPNGQTVLLLDTETGSISQPVTDSDAHFLAWAPDGETACLKVDTLGSPKIVRINTDGGHVTLAIPEFTYDLAAKPGSSDFIFTLSRGFSYGSELYLAKDNGRRTQLLVSDRYNYISFARFSPEGAQISFIKIPDTQTPFTVGELWVMEADGANARKLADADAGHGYATDWSPDGRKIAFVVRENPNDETADRSSEALASNIYLVDVTSGELTQVTHLNEGFVETPHWSPDGNTLAFNVVINGRMTVSIAEVDSAEVKILLADSACCPAWMRK